MKDQFSKPLISVVIPVYNGEAYLEEAVDSVLNSSIKDFEILLINDGSSDKSAKIVRKLKKEHKNIKSFFFKKNQGLGNVLNFALKKASGKYIARLNQDDLMHPERLKFQSQVLEENPKIVAVGSYLTQFNENGNTETLPYPETDKQIKQKWFFLSPFADPAVMYRKDKALELGGYNQNLWPAEDLHLWYRMGIVGKLANLPKPLTKMRIHKKAASQTHFRTQIKNTYRVHRWAHKNISSAPATVQIYWLAQLVSGLLFGPKINWFLYKKIKPLLSK